MVVFSVSDEQIFFELKYYKYISKNKAVGIEIAALCQPLNVVLKCQVFRDSGTITDDDVRILSYSSMLCPKEILVTSTAIRDYI